MNINFHIITPVWSRLQYHSEDMHASSSYHSLASSKLQSVASGSWGSRESHSNCVFCFPGSATLVIKRVSLQKFKMCEFKNTANGLKLKMREH